LATQSPARAASRQIYGIIAHPVDRDQFKLWTGRDDLRRGPQFAPRGNGANARANLSQKGRLISGLEIAMHLKGRLERNLVPIRIGAHLQEIWF
jgi:hypothetical protein